MLVGSCGVGSVLVGSCGVGSVLDVGCGEVCLFFVLVTLSLSTSELDDDDSPVRLACGFRVPAMEGSSPAPSCVERVGCSSGLASAEPRIGSDGESSSLEERSSMSTPALKHKTSDFCLLATDKRGCKNDMFRVYG